MLVVFGKSYREARDPLVLCIILLRFVKTLGHFFDADILSRVLCFSFHILYFYLFISGIDKGENMSQ